MFLKHLIIVPIIFIIAFSLGWFGRPYVESKMAANEAPSTTKVYQGFDFSFEYPVSYTASEIGLWSEGRYGASLNLPKGSDVGPIPDIKLINVSFSGTAQEFLESEFSTDVSLWPKETEGFEFEQIQVGEETVWKMRMNEHFDVTEYVKQNGTRFVGFKIYFSDADKSQGTEILQMLGSLKFE